MKTLKNNKNNLTQCRGIELFNHPNNQSFLNCIPLKNNNLQESSNSPEPFDHYWKSIDWKQCTLTLDRMQHEIFINKDNCRMLQEKLVAHPVARIISVRQIAFLDKGKSTAGVDQIKKISKCEAIMLAKNVEINGKASLIRRKWIPKPDSSEKRPLGISTIKDRVKQNLLKLAIEPQWEARFNPRVFGFRPARSCIDAIWNIRNILKNGDRYVYDGDLEKCFDKISHNYLIGKLGFNEEDIFTKQIRSWLKAGILDPRILSAINLTMGTTQGGVISPLLCNIALHGMEEFILHKLRSQGVRSERLEKIKLITYADDWVLICDNKRVLFLASEAISEFLKPIGLDIKESKSRKVYTGSRVITYGLNLIETVTENGIYKFKENEIYLPVVYGKKTKILTPKSFDFLGFRFRTHPVGKHKVNKNKSLHIKVYCIPTNKSIKKHFCEIRKQLRKCVNPINVVSKLSPIIRGWTNYFSHSDLRTVGRVGALRTRLNKILLNWQYRTRKTRKRLEDSWKTINQDKWRFYAIEKSGREVILPTHSDPKYSLIKYIPIRGKSSLFDGDIAYWSIRRKSIMGLSIIETKILAEQKGKCQVCNKLINIFDNVIPIKINMRHTKKGEIKLNKKARTRIIHINCKEHIFDASSSNTGTIA